MGLHCAAPSAIAAIAQFRLCLITARIGTAPQQRRRYGSIHHHHRHRPRTARRPVPRAFTAHLLVNISGAAAPSRHGTSAFSAPIGLATPASAQAMQQLTATRTATTADSARGRANTHPLTPWAGWQPAAPAASFQCDIPIVAHSTEGGQVTYRYPAR